MKISIVVSVPEAKFPVAYRREVARSLEKAKELDYDGVELSFTEPDKVNVGLLRELVGSLGLEVPALATGLSYVHFGLSFADRDPVVRDATVRRVKEYIRLASELGSAVVVGLIRGKAGEDAPLETAWGWNVECLKDCAREAEELGVTLALEPLNRYETDIVNTVDDGLRLISEIGSEQVGMLVDTFHMNIEERSIPDSLRRAGDVLAHVHVADSNRLAPGMGHIDFAEVIRALREVGYERYISAEILPKPDPDTAARYAIRYLRRIVP